MVAGAFCEPRRYVSDEEPNVMNSTRAPIHNMTIPMSSRADARPRCEHAWQDPRQGRLEMRAAVTALSFFAAMSVSSHADALFNNVAEYSACQEDALHGEHYAINGDCPNWETWQASHGQGRQAYPTPR